jgi:PAS domain S-box-containing protein
MVGYTAEEAVGRHITLIVPADRRDEEANILERLRRGQQIENFETCRMRKDGTLLDVFPTISPIRDAAARVVGASRWPEHALRACDSKSAGGAEQCQLEKSN